LNEVIGKKHKVLTFVGSKSRRHDIIEKFRDEAQILITTDIANEGLNLEFCSCVINFDTSYNTLDIEQRILRCHRQNQQNDVLVVNLINGQNASDIRALELYNLADSIYTIRQGLFDVDTKQLTISNERVLENLQAVQKKNGLPQSTELDLYEGKDFLNFTVEMETGTGKTFVYTNTILELHKNFGWKKFVIVVPPSTAIREGVINSLNATREYFGNHSDHAHISYEFFAYKGEIAQKMRSFANSSNVQIMVITKGSFDSASNIMNKGKSREDFRAPIEFIRDVRPVVIIDEPQSVDTQDVGKEAI